jgi:hypothetical protein
MRLIRRSGTAKSRSCGTHAGRPRAARQPDGEFGVLGFNGNGLIIIFIDYKHGAPT